MDEKPGLAVKKLSFEESKIVIDVCNEILNRLHHETTATMSIPTAWGNVFGEIVVSCRGKFLKRGE